MKVESRHPRELHLVFCYRNYANNPGVSHIGLGTTSMNCAKYFTKMGVKSYVLPCVFEKDIESYLEKTPSLTHVVIAALWVKTETLAKWVAMYPSVEFAVNCHSNAGFLQSEPEAITLIRQALALEELAFNFHMCGNSRRFCAYIEDTYGSVCTHLPNLYYIHHLHERRLPPVHAGGLLRIGMFGALRSVKNFNTGAAAALQIARTKALQTELWINVGRNDGGDANTVLRAIRNATRGNPWLTLRELKWQDWPEFRKTIGSMHLLLQPSYTETFNGVTADGIVEGVPSVVSSAIQWAPEHWKANVDSVHDIARVGLSLLRDPNASREGMSALKEHNRDSFTVWLRYLLDKTYGSAHESNDP